jgi:hypothetical protein
MLRTYGYKHCTVEGLAEEGPEKKMLADHDEQDSRLYLRTL